MTTYFPLHVCSMLINKLSSGQGIVTIFWISSAVGTSASSPLELPITKSIGIAKFAAKSYSLHPFLVWNSLIVLVGVKSNSQFQSTHQHHYGQHQPHCQMTRLTQNTHQLLHPLHPLHPSHIVTQCQQHLSGQRNHHFQQQFPTRLHHQQHLPRRRSWVIITLDVNDGPFLSPPRHLLWNDTYHDFHTVPPRPVFSFHVIS